MGLEDTACVHCGAMAGACADYPHCEGGPTEAERLRGALNRLGAKNAELEAANRELAAAARQIIDERYDSDGECLAAAITRLEQLMSKAETQI